MRSNDNVNYSNVHHEQGFHMLHYLQLIHILSVFYWFKQASHPLLRSLFLISFNNSDNLSRWTGFSSSSNHLTSLNVLCYTSCDLFLFLYRFTPLFHSSGNSSSSHLFTDMFSFSYESIITISLWYHWNVVVWQQPLSRMVESNSALDYNHGKGTKLSRFLLCYYLGAGMDSYTDYKVYLFSNTTFGDVNQKDSSTSLRDLLHILEVRYVHDIDDIG